MQRLPRVDRGSRGEPDLGEIAHVGAHGLGEGLQERTTARRAGLVDRDRVDGAVADLQELHVLTADVDDAGDAGADLGSGAEVGHRLDLALVGVQRGLDQLFAVAGDARAADEGALGQRPDDLAGDVHRGGDRVALVRPVGREDDRALGVQHHRLDGGRAGVDAQPDRPTDPGEIALGHIGGGVPALELGALLFVGEQRTHGPRHHRDLVGGVQLGGEVAQAECGALRREGGAQCHVELAVLGSDVAIDVVAERALEGGAQLGQEVQGAAEEDDLAADRVPAGKPGDGLGGDRLEDRGGDVLVGGALVEQRLHIGLGEDAAARGDRVEVGVVGREGVQAGGVHLEQGRHLVDEGARAAGAGAVHTLLGHWVQVGDLGVLAAEFDDDVDLGVEPLDGVGGRDHLLDELDAHDLRHTQPAGAGHRDLDQPIREGGLDVAEQFGELTAHIGVVAAVVTEDDLAVAVDDDGLDRCRPNIETQGKRGGHFVHSFAGALGRTIILFLLHGTSRDRERDCCTDR